MAKRTDIRVQLSEQQASFVRERVNLGRFATEGEVVREALQLLEQREHELDAARRALHEKLQRGIDQADRGELVDGEKFMAQLRRKLERQRKRSSAA